METDGRPAKIRKLSHEPDAAPQPDASSSANHVSMQDAPSDAGTAQSTSTPTQTEADSASALKSSSIVNPSAGTETPTTAAALPNTTAAATSTTEAPTASTTTPSDAAPPQISKSMAKKIRKQQEWDAKKADRKVWRKEKNQAKKERKREERKKEAEADPEAFKARLRQSYTRPTMLPITFVVDCDFDDKMRDNERVSLAGQITRCYSDNKNAKFRAHLAVCSFGGKLKERFDGVLNKNYTHWKGVRFMDEDFVVAGEKAKEWMADDKKGGRLAGVFEKYAPAKAAAEGEQAAGAEADAEDKMEDTNTEEPKTEESKTEEQNTEEQKDEAAKPKNPGPKNPLAGVKPSSLPPADLEALHAQAETIYLSADSPHTLTELKPFSTYIIGGLVDKNREKGICQARAEAAGMQTARLPIGDYLAMASRKVLTTNHVHEIMVRWLETGEWGEAFMSVIPKRKGGQLKGYGDGDEGADEEEGDGEQLEEQEAEEENREEADEVAATQPKVEETAAQSKMAGMV